MSVSYCPNCSEPCDVDAQECLNCGAMFGPNSAWKLTAVRGEVPSIPSEPRGWLYVPLGWFLILLAAAILVLVGFFTFTCRPGGCSGVPLAFAIFVCTPTVILGVQLTRAKR